MEGVVIIRGEARPHAMGGEAMHQGGDGSKGRRHLRASSGRGARRRWSKFHVPERREAGRRVESSGQAEIASSLAVGVGEAEKVAHFMCNGRLKRKALHARREELRIEDRYTHQDEDA